MFAFTVEKTCPSIIYPDDLAKMKKKQEKTGS